MRTPRTAARANELYLAALDRSQHPPLGEVKASHRALVATTTACLRQAARQNARDDRGKPVIPFRRPGDVPLPPPTTGALVRRARR